MISVELLKAALRVKSGTENAYIQALEEAAVAYIERETGRYYGPVRTATEVVIGSGVQRLYLAGPIALDVYGAPQIASVNEAAFPGETPTEIVEADDNAFLARGSVLYRKAGGSWLRGYEYTVVYEQGYAEGEEPADIRQAVTQLVTHWFETRLPVSETQMAHVPFGVQATIDANRIIRP